MAMRIILAIKTASERLFPAYGPSHLRSRSCSGVSAGLHLAGMAFYVQGIGPLPEITARTVMLSRTRWHPAPAGSASPARSAAGRS